LLVTNQLVTDTHANTMTSISSFSRLSPALPAWAALAPAGLPALPGAATSGAQAPVPSGAATATSADTLPSMQPRVTSPLTWEQKSGDAVTSLMTSNYASPSLSGRFQGLGAALLNRFSNAGGDFSQSVLQSASGARGATPIALSQNALHGAAANQITLAVQTADGVTVTLSLGSQDNGLAVQVKSSGKLSDADRGALAQLSGAFQNAIDGIGKVPPKLDLGGLAQYDTTLLSSVDLHAQVQTGSTPQTLTFHADSAQRAFSSDGPDGSIKVSVDLIHPASTGGAQQRSAAIDAYLKQFDQAGSRGNPNPAMLAMFKDAFQQLNSAAPQQGGGKASTLTEVDHAMLTGLADFSASLTDTPGSPNPMRPGEADTFAYQASQTTSVGGHGPLDRTLSQKQHTHLDASFHQALTSDAPPALDDSKQSQNYDYRQISDDASGDAEVGYSQGALAQASLRQTASQSTRVSTYVMGQLTGQSTTPATATLSRDMLGLLKAAQQLGGQAPQDGARRQQALATIHDTVLLQSDPARLRSAGTD